VRTTGVIIGGREFFVSSLSCQELNELMELHLASKQAIEAEPKDVRAILTLHRRMLEYLYSSVRRAQPGVTPEDFDAIDPGELLDALSAAIAISSPSKHFIAKFSGDLVN
jgi:hypothetical protein